MQPVTEGSTQLKGAKLKSYQKNLRYYPYYGRGLVQITHDYNYEKFHIKNLDDALKWDIALPIAFRGMTEGLFTGKKLSNYFNKRGNKPKEARQIVNGMDKASLIETFYVAFLGALNHALKTTEPDDVSEDAEKPDGNPLIRDPQVITTVGTGIATSILTSLASPYAVAGLVVIVLSIGIGLYVYLRHKEKWNKGT
jgi:putative chitinase